TGVIESEPDSGIISLGAEPVLAGLDNSEEPPENENSTSGAEQLGESIDLSVILAKADTEPTLHSNSAPLEVTIDDVLSDSEQSEVLALNIDSEQQSLAFDPNDSISSQPASDIQSESEDMIKKLIEDGNKSVDI
ncbi:MAG: hypothetical protein VX010_04840, partial [Pseudomonadota bacterium]|nr:hypothetical protein [Pseudomonadota bacterium]